MRAAAWRRSCTHTSCRCRTLTLTLTLPLPLPLPLPLTPTLTPDRRHHHRARHGAPAHRAAQLPRAEQHAVQRRPAACFKSAPLARGRGRGGCCCPGPHPWACVGLGLAWGLGIFQRAHSTERRRCRSCTCRVCRCASRSRMRCRPESWRASWLHRAVCVCVCAQPAAEPRAGRVREHWHGVLGHTLQPQPAPLAVSPASRQLRPQSAANSSLGHACGWLWAVGRLWYP